MTADAALALFILGLLALIAGLKWWDARHPLDQR